MSQGAAPECKVFEKDVGEWDAEVEVYPGPGAPVQRSTGRLSCRLASGGRWLISDFRNETSGFQGHGVYGFDTLKRTYVGTWVDDLRSFLTLTEGTWDAAAKTMTFRGEVKLPDRTLAWRDVTRTVNADTQIFSSYFPGPDGAEFLVMQATYRRRKG